MLSEGRSIIEPTRVGYQSTIIDETYTGVLREIQIRVYETFDDMRREATLYAVYAQNGSIGKLKVKNIDFTNANGVTMTGEWDKTDVSIPNLLCAPHIVIFLSKEDLSLETVSHELVHAAQFLRSEISDDTVELQEETMPYLVGDMLRQCDEAGIIERNDSERQHTAEE